MIEDLKRICELQADYASSNTLAMQERGKLIRRNLPAALREMAPAFAQTLGPFGVDLGIQGSDGIGRKTEAPWVRIFSARMSPAPTDGYYVVVHFARNGSAVFVTVGFGSNVWVAGDLRAESDAALAARRAWSRAIIAERFGSLAPFEDEIVLGAKAKLPRTFEKATSVARRISAVGLDEKSFQALLLSAVERLRVVYDAQAAGRDLTPADLAEQAVLELSRPERGAAGGRGSG